MSASKSYRATQVFTPSTPATLTFVERQALSSQLVDAIRTPGKQIIVFGHSGSGKTTLIDNKLEQTTEHWIRSTCTSTTTVQELLVDAFDQLDVFYTSERSQAASTERSPSISAQYGAIRAQLSSKNADSQGEQSRRLLPPQLTASRLTDFLGDAGNLWWVDDFHKLTDDQKLAFSQIMKVFVDASMKYPDIKIIATGAVGSAHEVVSYDAEMNTRIAEVHVPLMTNKELIGIITKGEQYLNCRFSDMLKTSISGYSSGLASVCHQLCLNACQAAGIEVTSASVAEITEKDMQEAVARYIDDASATLKAVFSKASRKKRESTYDNCRLILNALSHFESEGATFSQIYQKIKIVEPKYPSGNLTTYLRQLQTPDRGEVLRFDEPTGCFFFSDPIYHVFVKMHRQKPQIRQRHLFQTEADLRNAIVAELFQHITNAAALITNDSISTSDDS